MLNINEFLLAAQDLFGAAFNPQDLSWKPIICDLVNQQRPANMGDVMYYGHFRAYVRNDNDANQASVGSCKLFLGGEEVLTEGILLNESKTIGDVLFTDWELENCRGLFNGYIIQKTI